MSIKAYKKIILIVLFIAFQICTSSVVSASETLVNEVLFTLSDKSYTLYDQTLYKKVLAASFKKNKLSDYSKSEKLDYLFFEICLREAETFKVTASEEISLDIVKKMTGYSADEVLKMNQAIANVLTYKEARPKQNSDLIRYNSWIELLKRKYQFKSKSDLLK